MVGQVRSSSLSLRWHLLIPFQAIIWLDTGRDLPHTNDAPWEAFPNKGYHANNDPLPTIRQIPSKILASMTRPDSSHGVDRPYFLDSLPPSIKHLAYQYGLTLHHRVAAIDRGYALSEVLLFAACGEVQFLNLIEQRVRTIMNDLQGQETCAIDELNYTVRLLQSLVQHISDVCSFPESSASGTGGNAQRLYGWVAIDQKRPPEALQA